MRLKINSNVDVGRDKNYRCIYYLCHNSDAWVYSDIHRCNLCNFQSVPKELYFAFI